MAIVREGWWELKNYSRNAGQFSYVSCFKDPVAACNAVDKKAWVSVDGKIVPYNKDRHKDKLRVDCGSTASAAYDPYHVAFMAKEMQRELELTQQDIDDIIKVTSTEVDLLVKDIDQRQKQAAGVIDTILNRVYLEKGNVRKVLNANAQFSAITGKQSKYGSIEKTPDSEIKEWTAQYTEQYLQERANGKKSIIGGHYNYLNPKKSDPVPLKQWGYDVVEQAKKSGLKFGQEPDLMHYHGTAKGVKQAPAFKVILPKGFQPKWRAK